jgi:rubrerythrin
MSAEVELRFHNFYRCPICGAEWEDEWDCTCDDECPACGLKGISPFRSEDI